VLGPEGMQEEDGCCTRICQCPTAGGLPFPGVSVRFESVAGRKGPAKRGRGRVSDLAGGWVCARETALSLTEARLEFSRAPAWVRSRPQHNKEGA